jgi:hypothetical protein
MPLPPRNGHVTKVGDPYVREDSRRTLIVSWLHERAQNLSPYLLFQTSQKKLSIEKIARQVKRNQLIRCWQSVVNEYPPVAGMEKEQAADWLLALEDQGKLRISFDCNNELLEPRILPTS